MVIFTLIFFVLASAFMGTELTREKISDASMNNSNHTSGLNDNFNNTNKTPAGPVSIPLEKSPFIDLLGDN